MKMLIASFAVCASFAASAQDLNTGTVDVYFQPVRVEGRLEGCSLVFTALERDNAYLKNEQIVLNGSFVIRTLNKNNLFFTGKLGTRKLHGEAKHESPSHFYFATRTGTTAGVGKFHASDTEGYKLLLAPALQAPVSTFLMELVDEGRFTVGFNRVPGGQDVLSVIQVNVALTKDAQGNAKLVQNDKTLREFAECISHLTSAVQHNIQRAK